MYSLYCTNYYILISIMYMLGVVNRGHPEKSRTDTFRYAIYYNILVVTYQGQVKGGKGQGFFWIYFFYLFGMVCLFPC